MSNERASHARSRDGDTWTFITHEINQVHHIWNCYTTEKFFKDLICLNVEKTSFLTTTLSHNVLHVNSSALHTLHSFFTYFQTSEIKFELFNWTNLGTLKITFPSFFTLHYPGISGIRQVLIKYCNNTKIILLVHNNKKIALQCRSNV